MRSGNVIGPLLLTLGMALPAQGQESRPPPFTAGEKLVYHVRMGALASGSGELRVDGPELLNGRGTYLLSFYVRGGFGPFRMEGRTKSWLDIETMSAVRFHKHERSPVSSATRTVELLGDSGVWRADDGAHGSLPTPLPLDELSFLYYVRSLPLPEGARYGVERHFEQDRNPVIITVLGRQETQVPAGAFNVVVVEMQVPADRHLKEGSAIRLHLTDDEWRVPVRIESSVRHVGRVVLTLETWNRHTELIAGAR